MTQFQPYLRQHDKAWWLKTPSKFLYMLRELSSGLFLLYGFILLAALCSLACGEAAFNTLMNLFSSQTFILGSGIVFVFSCIHSFTWFVLAPKAMPIVIAGKQLPDTLVVFSFYSVFFVICLVTFYLAVYH